MLHTDIHHGVPVEGANHLIAFDEAVSRTMSIARPVGVERVALHEACDRVLAQPAIALRTAPPVAVSAMDGFAIREADTSRMPARLRIVGKSFAGAGYSGPMHAGECVRIFTGAPLPSCADRVVIQEDVTVEGSVAIVASAAGSGRHVRSAGSDFRTGQVVVPAGRRLRPQHLIAAAAADLDHLEVFRRPRLSILCCGDELVAPGTAGNTPDRIPESVSVGVAALVGRWGAEANRCAILADDLPVMSAAVRQSLGSADALVIIAGASVGERDFAQAAFAGVDMRLLFSKVAMKPGKPVWLGEVDGKPVVGLPGNPTSALVTARLFLAPLVAGMVGDLPANALRWRACRCAGEVEPCRDRDVFVRAISDGGSVRPVDSQDSADQRALAEADVLVRVRPVSSPLGKEARVEAIDL
jgi:molybdopterin molybdotransferase